MRPNIEHLMRRAFLPTGAVDTPSGPAQNELHSARKHPVRTSIEDRAKRGELARAARREEILAAARRVFADRGFRGTTIADIAEEAGIALGTIYLYFSSKEDVFAALNDLLNEIIVTALTHDTPVRTLEDSVRIRVENVFDACAENRDLVRLVVLNTDPGSAASKRMRSAERARNTPMAEGLQRAMDAGYVRHSDPVFMTRLVFGVVSMAVYQAFVISDGRDADAFRDASIEILISYMRPR
jgi:AcrR family transcriptional regulator